MLVKWEIYIVRPSNTGVRNTELSRIQIQARSSGLQHLLRRLFKLPETKEKRAGGKENSRKAFFFIPHRTTKCSWLPLPNSTCSSQNSSLFHLLLSRFLIEDIFRGLHLSQSFFMESFLISTLYFLLRPSAT